MTVTHDLDGNIDHIYITKIFLVAKSIQVGERVETCIFHKVRSQLQQGQINQVKVRVGNQSALHS
jgi:hypothetical protein